MTLLNHEQVLVEARIREDIGEEEITNLMNSLLSLGQLQPILVRKSKDGKYTLIAGERRLVSCRRLTAEGKAIKGHELGEIDVKVIDEAPAHVELIREFAENNERKEFSYVEKAKFIRKFHETMIVTAKEAGGTWLALHTAASLNLTPASISYYLGIEEAIKTDPSVAKAETLRAAVKRMKNAQQQRARQVEVQEQAPDTFKEAAELLKLGNAMELINHVSDESIDLINFDPPWGDDTGHKSNENWDGFEDDTETSDHIINTLLPELYRVLKPNRMMIYWFRTWAQEDMAARLIKAGFNLKFARTPCIWFKPDKVSDQNRYPEKMLLSTYESFFIVRKGDPLLHVQGQQDVFSYPRVPRAALIHPTEKPLDLCADLLRLCSIPGEFVLDPTAGSAAFLHAALVSGRKPIGFELTPSIHSRAVTRLAEYLKTIRR